MSAAPAGLVPFAVGVVFAIVGCAGTRIEEGVFRGPNYRVTLPADWDVIADGRADLALSQRTGGGAMLVNATCEGRETGRPLDVLMRHLLFGLRDRRVVERDEMAVNGHPAARALFEGSTDAGPVLGEAYVVKRAGCVYDLLYVAPTASFAEGREVFRRFVQSLEGP